MPDYLPVDHYLPHEAPMVLLEKVINVSDEHVHCQVTVSKTGVLSPFLNDEGHLPSWFAIEIMAQTIGVWSGWHRREKAEENSALGMLLGGRAVRCQAPVFAQGSVLDIQMNLLLQDEKFGSFEGDISCHGTILVTGRLNTYQPNKTELTQLINRME
ncbi:hotdog family protein [Xenorhabdus sp. 42]|uniref:ApeP family dehydratase n=1 Tax=Xenorhabdus szentirmaii TaxID=290112 RepID=UPI000C03C33A|nr:MULTISPECIES: hotdog family protein [Xenorhabdus]MBD2779308.1 hotdog family protein [Xenorhabdus sp. 38]MBD2791260.1 hotdog family protein [Xenorhabdus sp. CUL]MBD2804705.1 hotdog family protein [Xenorhabdus sp. ZM]MBD2821955.1 hotdog family protein [Xenorhabdus sp. 42]MBD2824020.1 hotdog family protein [Xenorhabdus sp. 5]